MAEFDDLFDDLVPQGEVRFTLRNVFIRSDKPLVLVMRHAGDANAEYKSARAKIVREIESCARRNDADGIQAITIKLFAKTVITGWENCTGKDGAALAYTPALCAEFLTAIAKKAPDEIEPAFAHARNADNFRTSPAAAAEALGK